jgi:hypothetical protein
MVATFVTAFLVMGFIPPPSPKLSGDQIVALFSHDQDRIRLGGVLMVLGSAFLFPWVAVISVQLRRIEGPYSPMATTQLGSGALGAFLFLTPMIVLEAMAFKPDHLNPEVASTTYYLAWLFFIGTPVFAVIQNLSIAVAILQDTSPTPVFPRWAGYFNIWIALSFVPGVCCYFFDSGPFAWRGLLPWWIPLSCFGLWMAVMATLLLRAIAVQQAADEPEVAAESYRGPVPGTSSACLDRSATLST